MSKTEKIEETPRNEPAWGTGITLPMWIAGDVYCYGDGTVEGSLQSPDGNDLRLRRARGPIAVSPLRALGQIEELTCGSLWQWFANYFGSHEAIKFFALREGHEQQLIYTSAEGQELQLSRAGTIHLGISMDKFDTYMVEKIDAGKARLNFGNWVVYPAGYVGVWEATRTVLSGQLPDPGIIQELEELKAHIEPRRVLSLANKEDRESQLARQLFYLGDARDYDKIGRSLKAGIEYKAPRGAPLQMMDISDLDGMEDFELASCKADWIEGSARLVEEGELLPEVSAIEPVTGVTNKFPILFRRWGWPGHQVQRREDGEYPPDAKAPRTRKYCERVTNLFVSRGTAKLKKETEFPLLWLTLNELFEEMEAVGSNEPHNLCYRCHEPTKLGKPTCGRDACYQWYRYYTDSEYRRKKLGGDS